MRKTIVVILAVFLFQTSAQAYEQWKITHYSASFEECGKTDGITASGKKAKPNHTCACNWLPFGTRLKIGNEIYVVEDHGARSLFGSKKKHIKHIDIFCTTHSEAVRRGVFYAPVQIIMKGGK